MAFVCVCEFKNVDQSNPRNRTNKSCSKRKKNVLKRSSVKQLNLPARKLKKLVILIVLRIKYFDPSTLKTWYSYVERQKAEEEARRQEQLERERVAAETAEKERQAELARQAGNYKNQPVIYCKWENENNLRIL